MSFRIVFCLVFLALASCTPQFCESQIDSMPLFLMSHEVQEISLSKYLRGYNLQFTSSHPTNIDVFEPYHILNTTNTGFSSRYNLINVKVNKVDYYLWENSAIIAAQNEDSQKIAIKYGEMKGNSLPIFSEPVEYQLNKKVHCYSASIINQKLDVILDCMTSEDNKTYMCIINKQSSQPLCAQYSNFIDVSKNTRRVSEVITLQNQKYLVSALISDPNSVFQNQTFITIYDITEGRVQFNLIVDRRMLGLDSLSITDMVITKIKGISYIQVTDPNNGVIRFMYLKQNRISDVQKIKVQGHPYLIENSADGNLLVAVEKGIIQYTSDFIYVRKYIVEDKDVIIDMQASSFVTTALTSTNNLLTFDRWETQYRYLLSKEQVSERTAILLSPFFSNLVQFDISNIQLVEVSSGYIMVGKVDKSFKAVITANSSGLVCSATFEINFISEAQAQTVISKKVFNPVYDIESMSSQNFYLNDYFGGSNLNYEYSLKTDSKISQSSIKLLQVNKYKLNQPKLQDEESFYSIIEISETQYYSAKIVNNYVVVSLCTAQSEVTCTKVSSMIGFGKISHLSGRKTLENSYYFALSYEDKNMVEIYRVGSRSRTFFGIPNSYPISSVVAGEQLAFFLQKQQNILFVFSQYSSIHESQIDQSTFTSEEIEEMGGFYPRQIFLNPNNPNMFYVKLPVKIATMAFIDGKISLLSVQTISETFIPDNKWSVVVGHHTVLALTEDTIEEYSMHSNSILQSLHKISFTDGIILPPKYSSTADTVIFETQKNVLQYIKLNQAKIDTLTHQIQLNAGDQWVISNSWIIVPEKFAYFSYPSPRLSVSLKIENNIYNGNATMNLKATSPQDRKGKTGKSSIYAISYPINIFSTGENQDNIELPQEGKGAIVDLNISSYFNGSIANLQILCPYSVYDLMKVVTPFRNFAYNKSYLNIQKIVPFNNNIQFILSENSLAIVDQVKVSFVLGIDTMNTCENMNINNGILIVFCKGQQSELILFTATQKAIVQVASYPISSEIYIENVQDMTVWVSSTEKTYIALHDSDPFDESIQKKSDVKIFAIGHNNNSNIELVDIINGLTFSLPLQTPINSIAMERDHLFMSLGKVGLGHYPISSKKKGTLINLAKNEGIQKEMLSDTQFWRVKIISASSTKWQILITTSNSFSFVISLQSTFAFKIQETYNKYGKQQNLNWAEVSDKYILLSYYNSDKKNQSIALYERSTKGLVNFYASLLNQVSGDNLQLPMTSFIKSGKSYILSQGRTDGFFLSNITGSYGLSLSYDSPGHFDSITLTVSNDYTSVDGEVQVWFDGTGSSGLKWYAVVIMVALVLLVVGLAFGMYLRMKARKSEKNASLMTETEQIDEEV